MPKKPINKKVQKIEFNFKKKLKKKVVRYHRHHQLLPATRFFHYDVIIRVIDHVTLPTAANNLLFKNLTNILKERIDAREKHAKKSVSPGCKIYATIHKIAFIDVLP